MKNTKCIILILAIVVLAISLCACSENEYNCAENNHDFNSDGVCSICGYFESGLAFELNEDGESWAVNCVYNPISDVVIPAANSDGKPVTRIIRIMGEVAIKSIIIPDSVTTIDEDAFACTSISEIIIPSSVTSIGKSAFWGSDNLTRVIFEEGSQLTRIEDETFMLIIGINSNQITLRKNNAYIK